MLNGLRYALLLAALTADLPAAPALAVAAQERVRPEEKRVSHDAFMAMVAEPARLLEAGDLPGAEAAFERLLARHRARHGTAGVAVADRLMAFGLALYGRDEDQPLQQAMKARSLDYFRRAIPAYRAAFGPDHPEAALAIGTYADAALALVPDDPPQDLDDALQVAQRIYESAYGPADATTVSVLLKLARIEGVPSRTSRDPARIAASAEAFRRVVRALDSTEPDDLAVSPYRVLFALAEMYVRNGRLAEAQAVVSEIGERVRAANPDFLVCMQVGMFAGRYEEFLLERGENGAASELARIAWEGEDDCFGADIQDILLPEPG